MPIRAYGQFWERDAVDWFPGSGRRNAFRLLGRRGAYCPKLQVADFRQQQGLYVLHSAYGVYYVGLAQTGTLGKRLKDHCDDGHHQSWDRFSWFGFRDVLSSVDDAGICGLRKLPNLNLDTSGTAIRDLEALLISVLNPPGNKNWGNFVGAEQWEQVPSDEATKYLERVRAGSARARARR